VKPILREALDALLAASAPGSELTLDAVGDALSDKPVTPEEIGWLLDELEGAGRRVGGGSDVGAVAALGGVLAAARALRGELGRPARVDELAARARLSEREVRRALLFARVMGR
jgi:sigma-70-like protein